MLRSYQTVCSIKFILKSIQRYLPRSTPSATTAHQTRDEQNSDYAVLENSKSSPNVVFNDYSLIKPSSSTASVKIQSRPVPSSVPKLVDAQTGLNEFLGKCDEKSLLRTIESKSKLFDAQLTATFVQRLKELNIGRDSKESHHQRLFDYVDYFVLKHGNQFDFDHVLTMFYQLASINGKMNLNSGSGSYAVKGLIQLLKHHINKYHLEETGKILITLENEFACQIKDDQRIRPLHDALLLLTKFRQTELDRLEAQALAELAYVFATELDHVYFTNILTEYIHDEYYHDKYSTMLMFKALLRRGYRHNRTLDVCLHFVNENKDLFVEEMSEIKECLEKLQYDAFEE